METLQGLCAYLEATAPSARPSPFDVIATLSDVQVAKTIALAFRTSHQMTDVWAALRFYRAQGNADLTPWLMGHAFAAWHTGHDRDMSDLAVSDLREMAWEWLEGKNDK